MKYKVFTKLVPCFVMLTFAVIVTGCGRQSPTILLTGYWPPTNQMLAGFSADKGLNDGKWQGKNFLESGYDVYAFFPTFPEGTDNNPSGCGEFTVDFSFTYVDTESTGDGDYEGGTTNGDDGLEYGSNVIYSIIEPNETERIVSPINTPSGYFLGSWDYEITSPYK